jgi:hypothetical protein
LNSLQGAEKSEQSRRILVRKKHVTIREGRGEHRSPFGLLHMEAKKPDYETLANSAVASEVINRTRICKRFF